MRVLLKASRSCLLPRAKAHDGTKVLLEPAISYSNRFLIVYVTIRAAACGSGSAPRDGTVTCESEPFAL